MIYIKDEGYPILLPEPLRKHFEKFKPIILPLKENFLKNEIAASIVAKWLRYGNYFVLFTPKKESYFIGEKIIAPYRCKSNIFSYNDGNWFSSKDIVYILKKDGRVSLKYLTGLLNSRLIGIWLKTNGKRKGEILELYVKPLSEIPIVIADSQQPIIDLVDQILVAKKLNPQADISALEIKIDRLVYTLFNLTEAEIKLIENKCHE